MAHWRVSATSRASTCAVLEIPPSTYYYAARKREENPSERDEGLKREIMWVREGKGPELYGRGRCGAS